jgi:hypothetical protein
MGQWGNTDDSANSVFWANTTLNVAKNQTELYGNTTVSAVIANAQVGVFGVSTDEIANTASGAEGLKIGHAGWVRRKEGRGGRAGRVQYETLVAMSSITGDAGRVAGDPSDDDTLPE